MWVHGLTILDSESCQCSPNIVFSLCERHLEYWQSWVRIRSQQKTESIIMWCLTHSLQNLPMILLHCDWEKHAGYFQKITTVFVNPLYHLTDKHPLHVFNSCPSDTIILHSQHLIDKFLMCEQCWNCKQIHRVCY